VSFFFIGNVAILGIVSYLVWRPHRAKLFVSYSHKDAEIAKRILSRLESFHFRIWVDFGLSIAPARLKEQLSRNVRRRQIFLLLASRNSVESDWVKFEIEQAKTRGGFLIGQWRDTVIVALDDDGVRLYESLKQFIDEVMLAAWIKEKQLTDPDEIAEMAARLARLQTVDVLPIYRRVFVPTIKLIDLREQFEMGMDLLEEHLRINTRMGRVAANRRKIIKQLGYAFMIYELAVIILTGILLLILILYNLLVY
jgi:hypothetical protein